MTLSNSRMLCASVDTAILIPAACAERAFSAERSRRSGLALISKKQPFFRAWPMIRSMSIS